MPGTLHVPCPRCGALNRAEASRLAQASCGKCKAPLAVGTPLHLDQDNFERMVGKSDLPVLVDFWAPWCGPCRSMAPAFEQAAGVLAPAVRLGKVDTEANPGLGQAFRIQSIPTMVLFRQGREVARVSGAMSAQQIAGWVRQHV